VSLSLDAGPSSPAPFPPPDLPEEGRLSWAQGSLAPGGTRLPTKLVGPFPLPRDVCDRAHLSREVIAHPRLYFQPRPRRPCTRPLRPGLKYKLPSASPSSFIWTPF